MSINLIPTSYTSSENALVVAEQIHSNTVIYKDKTHNWKIILVNEPSTIVKDINSISFGASKCLISINDRLGHIHRKVSRINSGGLITVGKILQDFKPANNIINQELKDLNSRIRKYIGILELSKKGNIQAESEKEEVQIAVEGLFVIRPIEFFCYFKKFVPNEIKLRKISDENTLTGIGVYLKIQGKKDFDVIEPIFRLSEISLPEIKAHIEQNKPVRVELELNSRTFSRISKLLMETQNIDEIMILYSPLRKGILTDLMNYRVKNIELL